jgi:hypothetical protein
MQVVSGPLHRRKVHFEAPPSDRIANEMKAFNIWFKETTPQGKKPLPAPLAKSIVAAARQRLKFFGRAQRDK